MIITVVIIQEKPICREEEALAKPLDDIELLAYFPYPLRCKLSAFSPK
jgi:hypothetical protein